MARPVWTRVCGRRAVDLGRRTRACSQCVTAQKKPAQVSQQRSRRQSDRVLMADVQLELDRLNMLGTLPAPPSRPPSAPCTSTAPQTPAILPLVSDVELSEGEEKSTKNAIQTGAPPKDARVTASLLRNAREGLRSPVKSAV